MKGLADIHSHILFGVDDGALDMDCARRMLMTAYDDGIRAIIATPHYSPGSGFNADGGLLDHRLSAVRSEAEKIARDLRIYLGNEIFYSGDILRQLRDGQVRTLNESRYVLLEFMPQAEYSYIRDAVCRVRMEGYLPILAHVERYACLRKNIQAVESLVGTGAYIQVNASGILGKHGLSKKQELNQLLSRGLVHFVASDAHDPRIRQPKLSGAAELIHKRFGQQYAGDIFYHNPRKVIENEII